MYSVANYKKLIRAALESKFQFRFFDQAADSDRSLILRFDIDYSLSFAQRFAALNKNLGVSGTFFLRTRNNLYNPASYRAQKAIDNIRSHGQAIALHIELPLPEAHFPSEQSLQEFIEKEFELASQLIGETLPVFSWHNPSSFSPSQQAYVAFQPKGFLNTYAPPFTQNIKYISDSNLRYPFDEFLTILSAPKWPHIQLLLHPCQWVLNADTVDTILARSMAHQITENECEFQYNHIYAKRYPNGISPEKFQQMEQLITDLYMSD